MPQTARNRLVALGDQWDRETRAALLPVLDAALRSVEALSCLDDLLYARFEAHGDSILDGPAPRLELVALAADMLSDLRGLLPALEAWDSQEPRAPGTEPEVATDPDFAIAEEEPEEEPIGGLDSMDIVGAVGAIGRVSDAPGGQQWEELRQQLSAIGHALRMQLDTFDAHFHVALEARRFSQALSELNDVSSSLNDGLFALITEMFKPIVEDFRLGDYLPGHRTSLEKALTVRRALADLRSAVSPLNDMIQEKGLLVEQRQDALDLMASAVRIFVEGEDFRLLRPEERREVTRILESITDAKVESCLTACEGFTRFLESMKIESQRDAVAVHDRRLLNDLAEILEAVGPLMSISAQGARRMVADAVALALQLAGLSDDLDVRLRAWRTSPPDLTSPHQLEQVIRTLSDFVTQSVAR